MLHEGRRSIEVTEAKSLCCQKIWPPAEAYAKSHTGGDGLKEEKDGPEEDRQVNATYTQL